MIDFEKMTDGLQQNVQVPDKIWKQYTKTPLTKV